jgi:hypothetical protein
MRCLERRFTKLHDVDIGDFKPKTWLQYRRDCVEKDLETLWQKVSLPGWTARLGPDHGEESLLTCSRTTDGTETGANKSKGAKSRETAQVEDDVTSSLPQ